jgi:hypothetical protein
MVEAGRLEGFPRQAPLVAMMFLTIFGQPICKKETFYDLSKIHIFKEY